ncbi:MAG: MarR family transcriptional regulator [Flammeovirgaceae bacterium]|nr:MarR family transcriptional regulator [Flammeovirgaceae bacterium]
MNKEKTELVKSFVCALENLMMGMQQVDSSCMEAYSDVSKRDFALLIMLGKSDSMIMREIADFLQVPLSTATGIVDKLIEKGYVERQFSPEDRRIILIRLNKEGKAIYLTLLNKLNYFGTMLLEEFSNEDRIRFTQYMEKAANATSHLRFKKI